MLPALSRHVSFRVPVAEWVGEWGGDPFHVYRKIAGELLTDHQGAVGPSVIAAALRELHSFPVDEARRLLGDEGTAAAWRREYENLREKVERDVIPLLDDRLRADLCWAYDRFLADPMRFAPALVHRDLGTQHILIDPQRGAVAGIIDWESVGIGDPAIDFIGLWISFGSVVARDVLFAYGDVDPTFQHRLYFYRGMGAAHAIRYGLHTGDEVLVQGAIQELGRRIQKRPRVCAAVLRDDTILMVHHRGQFWTLPGGGMEVGEALETAVLRELAEETGLAGRVVRRLFDHPYSSGESICFLVEADGGVRVTGDDAVTAVQWFPLAEKADDVQVRHVIAALDQCGT